MSNSVLQDPGPGEGAPGYETTDVTIRPIAVLLGVLVVIIIVMNLVLWPLTLWFQNQLARVDPAPPPLAVQDQVPPEPRLQVNPTQDWDAMLATNRALLGSYGWVDQNGGVVRIPIERAMDLVIERGLPVREGNDPQATWPSIDESHNFESSGGQPPGTEAPAPAGE